MSPPFFTRYRVQVDLDLKVTNIGKVKYYYRMFQFPLAPLNYKQSRFIESPDFFLFKSAVKIPSWIS
jgi:hypothetical protein